jgi:hypothetical protein
MRGRISSSSETRNVISSTMYHFLAQKVNRDGLLYLSGAIDVDLKGSVLMIL